MHGTFPSIFKFHNMDTFSMPASVMSVYFVASPWDNSFGQFGFNLFVFTTVTREWVGLKILP